MALRNAKKVNWRQYVLFIACAVVLCMGLVACTGSAQDKTTETKKDTTEQTASGESATRVFTDSVGREVEVPTNIDLVAPSGHTAQQVLLTMAPDKLVGLSQTFDDAQLKYFGNKFADLPIFGAAFGNKGTINKEAVAASGAQIVIDTGEVKKNLKEDLDNLQTQLGIPVVFIATPLDDYATAYAMLGDLLGMPDRGKLLGDYCAKAYADTKAVMDAIPESQRVNMAYLVGDAGLNAIAKGSYQGSVVEMCANNVVEVEKATGSGLGNEISLEQIAVWNPELIVFGPNSIYDEVGNDPAWAGIDAIALKNYYEVPNEPWVWLNNPPTVNQILGMQWLPRVCYPDKFNNDMQDVVTGYFKTFYNYDLTQKEYESLVENALPRR